jgi:hypothetical protein
MYKGLCAVMAAAVCAAVFVGFVPPTAPAMAGVQTGEQAAALTAKTITAVPETEIRTAACAQAWPYYEASCLRDNRGRDGGAVVVRVVAIGRTAGENAHHVQH